MSSVPNWNAVGALCYCVCALLKAALVVVNPGHIHASPLFLRASTIDWKVISYVYDEEFPPRHFGVLARREKLIRSSLSSDASNNGNIYKYGKSVATSMIELTQTLCGDGDTHSNLCPRRRIDAGAQCIAPLTI